MYIQSAHTCIQQFTVWTSATKQNNYARSKKCCWI